MSHTDASRNASVTLGKVVDYPFTVNNFSFMMLSFIIPPLFGWTAALGLYGLVD